MTDTFWIRCWQVNFIDNWQDFQVIIQGQVNICQSLGFNSLCRINDQNSSFTGGQRTRNFIGKVHVSRRVNQVENVGFAVISLVIKLNSIELDGDTTLALQIHRVQELSLHFTAGNCLGLLQNTVSKCGFSMVNMSNNREVTNLLLSFFQFF
ncbi:Uncharacterised protein [Chlamydia trachomatis]|nr:Uncharacterised protein [Chlamydia trachomatis]